MTPDWRFVPLEEACLVEYGTRVVRKKDGGSVFPVYGGGGETFKMDTFNREDRVVVARFGVSETCVRRVKGKFFLNDSGLTISARNTDELLPAFLDYQLFALNDDIYDLCRGAAQKNLDVEAFRQLQIAIPRNLAEQRRIVAILDEALEAIATATANAEKNFANACELFDSYLNSAFEMRGPGWRTRSLEQLCVSDRVITYGVIKLGDEIPGGVPCLRTSNVRWLRIETAGIKRIAKALSDEYRRTILRGGEVLVNVRGTLGGVAVAQPEMAGWNVSREIAVVPTDTSQIDPFYLAYVIATRKSQKWLTGVQKGLAYIGINISDLRTLPIGLPDRNEQRRIVARLQGFRNESQRLESLYEEKLIKLSELKESIFKAAFSGELTSLPSIAFDAAAE